MYQGVAASFTGFSDRGPADSRDRGGYGFDRPDYSSGNRLDER